MTPTPATGPVSRRRQLEQWLIWLVVAHTLGVGFMLVVVPEWAVRFAGWNGADPTFFPRQAGIFHFVVAFGYLLEYHRHRSVTFLVGTKMIAGVFLLGAWILGVTAWSVPFSGITDALMGLVVWWVHRWASREVPFHIVAG